jgi:hypothetical protein
LAAVSITALTVLLLVTLMAGKAKPFCLAKLKISWTAAPVATPGLIMLLCFVD